jgi:hypothetical protein
LPALGSTSGQPGLGVGEGRVHFEEGSVKPPESDELSKQATPQQATAPQTATRVDCLFPPKRLRRASPSRLVVAIAITSPSMITITSTSHDPQSPPARRGNALATLLTVYLGHRLDPPSGRLSLSAPGTTHR